MCPVVMFSVLLSMLVLLVETASAFQVTFHPDKLKFKEGDEQKIDFTISNYNFQEKEDSWHEFQINIDDPHIADVKDGNRSIFIRKDDFDSTGSVNRSFVLSAKFLGLTDVYLIEVKNPTIKSLTDTLEVIVQRKQSLLSLIFTITVATLVSLNYINMGCALDLSVVKAVLMKPIAPLVGFMSQYVLMPLTAYVIGYFMLYESDYLRLGLFIFGCSPAGGASNMWTVLLNGNLDLSITMTFISTIAAAGMLPFWMYTLGKIVYSKTTTAVPVKSLMSTLVPMVVCLGIGLLFQKYLPRVAAFCKKILAPVSVAMIIFIITFGTYANLYMFKLMNLAILFSAGISVWIGFAVGYFLAWILRLPSKDQIAISIETGIQNTGIAYVLLGLSLLPPFNDIATVVPVAASIMTPIPLTIVWIIMKCRRRFCSNKKASLNTLDEDHHDTHTSRNLSNSSSSTLLSDERNGLQRDVRCHADYSGEIKSA